MTVWRFCPECARPLRAAAELPGHPPSCPDGHFTHWDNPAPTTIAIIERDGRYLLLRRARMPYAGEWDAPGGFIDGGESPQQCVQREVLEETGLVVTAAELQGVYPSLYGETGRRTLGIAYRCELQRGTLQLSDENSQARWFAPQELPHLPLADVREAFRRLAPTTPRWKADRP